MKEIRFRAWIKDAPMCYEDSGMYYQDTQYLSSFLRRIYDQYVVNHPSAMPFQIEERLMQFTGYLDKNEKEIYEGDILKYQHMKGYYIVKDMMKMMTSGILHAEIIGNIHENPDLIGTKEQC